jgi:hypothetical protein
VFGLHCPLKYNLLLSGNTTWMKHSATTKRKKKEANTTYNFFIVLVKKKKEPSSQSAMEQVSELISGSKSGVEPAKVLTEDSPSRDQNRRRKLNDKWCKEFPWLKFNSTTSTAIFEQYAYFLSTADQNSSTMKGFAGPIKLETFMKQHKSFQSFQNV